MSWFDKPDAHAEAVMLKRKGGENQLGDLTGGERLQIMLTRRELTMVDDWRFSRWMPSRAAAIRELLKRGLVSRGFASAENGAISKDIRS